MEQKPIDQDPELERQLRSDPFSIRTVSEVSGPESITSGQPNPSNQWAPAQEITFQSVGKHRAVRTGWKILGGIVALVLIGGVVVWYQQGAFLENKVTLKVDAPPAVEASQQVTASLSYANDNRVALENVDMLVYYPSGFHITALSPNMKLEGEYLRVSLGKIAPHSNGKLDVVGRFDGASESLGYIKAIFRYTPSGTSSVHEASSQVAVTLRSSSLALDIEAPVSVSTGAVVEYVVSYTNTTDAAISNMRLKISYPDSFSFTSAEPKASEGNVVWYLGTLAPHQSGKIHVSGTLGGNKGDTKVVKVEVGVLQGDGNLSIYASGERTSKIVTPPLVINQTVNGVAKFNATPGQSLRYALSYRNDGTVSLRNAIITFEMKSAILDFSLLQTDKGTFDSRTQTVTWKVSDIPSLATILPGQGGEVTVTINTKSQILPQGATDKNPTVVTVARIDSPDIPSPTGANKIVSSNTLTVPVSSAPSIAATVSYTDSAFPGSGPVPLVVGQETTYAVRLTVMNTTNDLKEGKVTATLAPNVQWKDKMAPESEHISFDQRTNTLTWDLGGVEAGAGTIKDKREIVFQVGITPAPNQAMNLNSLPLLNGLVLNAADTFTGVALKVPYASSVATPL